MASILIPASPEETRIPGESLLMSYPALSSDPLGPIESKNGILEQPMARAIWNGKVIAESEKTETVEGNVYFPEASLKREYFRPSTTTSLDPVKGQARYMTVVLDGEDNQDAAWYYPDPKPAARKIKGYVAFWRGVEVVEP